jgi:hypothetical protein
VELMNYTIHQGYLNLAKNVQKKEIDKPDITMIQLSIYINLSCQFYVCVWTLSLTLHRLKVLKCLEETKVKVTEERRNLHKNFKNFNINFILVR